MTKFGKIYLKIPKISALRAFLPLIFNRLWAGACEVSAVFLKVVYKMIVFFHFYLKLVFICENSSHTSAIKGPRPTWTAQRARCAHPFWRGARKFHWPSLVLIDRSSRLEILTTNTPKNNRKWRYLPEILKNFVAPRLQVTDYRQSDG